MLDTAFKDRSAKVLVVDPANPTRLLLTDAIRSLGFNDVTGVPTIEDAIAVLQREPIDWLVTTLKNEGESKFNSLQILREVTNLPELKQLRVTLWLGDDELFVLRQAFEMGLISYHLKKNSKQEVEEEFKQLLDLYEKSGWQSALVAGHYLRNYLLKLGRFEDQMELDKALVGCFPSHLELLMHIASGCYNTERRDEAKSILRQMKMLSPEHEDKVKARWKELFNSDYTDASPGEASGVNFLGLNHVVIVDSDEIIQKNVVDLFASIGVGNVKAFGVAAEVIAYVKDNPNIDLVISEWRLPKMAGPILIQKLRDFLSPTTPIVLLSSLVQKDDILFLKEMNVVDIIPKPFERAHLIQTLAWAIQQDRAPTEQTTMERKIRSFIQVDDLGSARALMAEYLQNAKIPKGSKLLMEAEVAYAEKNYEQAKKLAMESFKKVGESIFVLNLLGKTLMQLRDFPGSLKCFERAKNLVPQNIERLCLMAEAYSENGDNAKAEEAVSDAKDMDPDSVKVQETEAKVAINSGDVEKAKKVMNDLVALENVVAYLNNRAVALARVGEVEESLNVYQKAIQALPDSRPDFRAIVHYNLSLAYVRHDQYEDALKELEKIISCGIERIEKKAKSMQAKIKKAVAAGGKIQLEQQAKVAEVDQILSNGGSANEGEEAQAADRQEFYAAMQVGRAEIGCYMIYTVTNRDSKVSDLVKTQLKLKFERAPSVQKAS